MSEVSTSQAGPRSPLRRWVVIAAAAVPATFAAGTMINGGWSANAQVPTTTTTLAPATTTTIAPSDFVGITPVRVLDTRGAGQTVGVPSAAPLGPNQTIDVQITGALSGVPANATSVAINVTIDQDATLKSFLTVWPTGQTRPLASTNNAEPGFISPVSALMKLGTNGRISVFNQQGAVNVIIDVTGYFIADPLSTSTTSTSTTSTSTTTTTVQTP
jgi:hypothetical protein